MTNSGQVRVPEAGIIDITICGLVKVDSSGGSIPVGNRKGLGWEIDMSKTKVGLYTLKFSKFSESPVVVAQHHSTAKTVPNKMNITGATNLIVNVINKNTCEIHIKRTRYKIMNPVVRDVFAEEHVEYVGSSFSFIAMQP